MPIKAAYTRRVCWFSLYGRSDCSECEKEHKYASQLFELGHGIITDLLMEMRGDISDL
jgi:hypothetical protein